MSTDDRWGNDEADDRRERRDRRPRLTPAEARAKLAAPATLMILSGVLMLVLSGLMFAVMASGFDASVAILKWAEQMQPPGPEKQKLQDEIQKAQTRDKTAETVMNLGFGALGVVFDLLVLIGGIQMRRLRGRGLAMTGSICAMLPFNHCCCIGLPVGLWALIVLNNPDVKAAFAARPDRGALDEPADTP